MQARGDRNWQSRLRPPATRQSKPLQRELSWSVSRTISEDVAWTVQGNVQSVAATGRPSPRSKPSIPEICPDERAPNPPRTGPAPQLGLKSKAYSRQLVKEKADKTALSPLFGPGGGPAAAEIGSSGQVTSSRPVRDSAPGFSGDDRAWPPAPWPVHGHQWPERSPRAPSRCGPDIGADPPACPQTSGYFAWE